MPYTSDPDLPVSPSNRRRCLTHPRVRDLRNCTVERDPDVVTETYILQPIRSPGRTGCIRSACYVKITLVQTHAYSFYCYIKLTRFPLSSCMFIGELSTNLGCGLIDKIQQPGTLPVPGCRIQTYSAMLRMAASQAYS